MASGQVSFDRPGNYAIVGELALTGETRPIKGILSMALQAVLEGCDGEGQKVPETVWLLFGPTLRADGHL